MSAKIQYFLIAALSFTVIFPGGLSAKNTWENSQDLFFIENKGQITDQYYHARNDIQFAMQAPGINIFIGNGQIHYQFTRINVKHPDFPALLQKDFIAHAESGVEKETAATIETYRMDVELTGANKNAGAVISSPLAYYETYYLAGCPEHGAQAHTCRKITYKNIYKNIDWVIYIKDNKLEHEFVVGPGGNAADIKIRYSGQTSLGINADGSITAGTPMGVITEHAPVCFDKEGNVLQSAFRLKNNILGYATDHKHDIIIDPVLEWGTYYGPDTNNTSVYSMICDNSGHLYACGLTWSPTYGNVATIGSYQAIYGGNCDAFLVKFDTAGHRIWGTYYGGTAGDWGNGVAMDKTGNLYLVGTTESTSAIATPGAQQAAWGGNWDAFLAKFDTSGSRLWGTYAGGTGLDYPYAVAADTQGHVYISGSADSYNNIATPGSFMPTHGGGHDDFLIQYNTTTGLRVWGTYVGGNSDDLGGIVASDGYYAYLAGYTQSATGIATPLCHQPVLAGPSDAFVEKFNPSGTRDWGTYFGGSTPESVGGLTCDRIGNVYLLGATGSDTGIATPGCAQPVRGGSEDAFLAKINPDLGTVFWSTYFGGPDNESVDLSRIACDTAGNILITGYTTSLSGIASATGAWQTTFGGGDADCFFAKYNPNGGQYWSTYYGGNQDDEGRSVASDGKAVYLSGMTSSPDHIATPGSFLDSGSTGSLYFKGFIAKFVINDTPPSLHVYLNQAPAEDLRIYPNPNKGSFTVSGTLTNAGNTARLTVTDMAGRILMKDEANVHSGVLNEPVSLYNLPQGAYLLEVVSNGKSRTLRFVKE